jgi:hypothetical protein
MESKDEQVRREMGWSTCAPTDQKLDARHTAWWLADGLPRDVPSPAVASCRPRDAPCYFPSTGSIGRESAEVQGVFWSHFWGMD